MREIVCAVFYRGIYFFALVECLQHAHALGSRGPAGSSPGAPPGTRSPRPLFPALFAQPGGVARGPPLARARGVLLGIFPSCRVFSRVTHRIWGVRPPMSARGGLRAWVWSGQGVRGADLLLIVVLGGSFLPGEGSLVSPLTFFPFARCFGSGGGIRDFFVFLILQP